MTLNQNESEWYTRFARKNLTLITLVFKNWDETVVINYLLGFIPGL